MNNDKKTKLRFGKPNLETVLWGSLFVSFIVTFLVAFAQLGLFG